MRNVIKLSCLSLFLGLSSCSMLDDYLLGKDNTVKPKALAPLEHSHELSKLWAVPAGHSLSHFSYHKLKPELISQRIITAFPDGTVQVTNAKTGDVIWSKQLPSSIISGPAVSQDYIALGLSSAQVILLNASNGAFIWKKTVSGDVLAKPVFAKNKVLAKTIDGNLYAFDLTTGKKAWVSEHGSPHLILKTSASPVVKGSQIIVGYSDGKLDAIDIKSGIVLWQRSIAYASGASDLERLVDIDANPIVEGDKVFIASYQGYIGSLLLSNGEFAWRKPSSVFKDMSSDTENLYYTDSDDTIWSLNKQSGHVNWKQSSLQARGLTETIVLGQFLAVADKTGYLHVLSKQTGEFVARAQLAAPVFTSPVADADGIYVLAANGQLYRFKLGKK